MPAAAQVAAPLQWQTFAVLLSTRFDFAGWLASAGSDILLQRRTQTEQSHCLDFRASLSVRLFDFLCSESGLARLAREGEVPEGASVEKAASLVTRILLDSAKSPVCWKEVCRAWAADGEQHIGWDDPAGHPPVTKDWWGEKKERPPFDPRASGCRLRSFTAEQAQSLVKSHGHFGRTSEASQQVPDPFYSWLREDQAVDHRTLPGPPPGISQLDPKCLYDFKLGTLKTFCRQQKLLIGGIKKTIVDRILGFLGESNSMREFDDRLEELNLLFFHERRLIDGGRFVVKFRTQAPLDVAGLLPADLPVYPPPLPQVCPWSVREELTPPLLLFQLDRQVDAEYRNGDNHLALQIHHTVNTPLILNVYRVVDRTLPEDRLLLRNNLQTPGACCLRACLSVPGMASAWNMFAVAGPSTELRLPHSYRSGPLQLSLWRIRSSDNLVIQLVRAFHSPAAFPPSAPVMSMPRSVGMECVIKAFFGGKDEAPEDGVVVDSISVSLRCPLSLAPIQTPVRSVHCRHLQCFDHSSFVSVFAASVAYSFKCPVCYKDCALDSLVVDEYFGAMIDAGRPLTDPTVSINPSTGEFRVVEGCGGGEDADDDADGDELIVKRCRPADLNDEPTIVEERVGRLSSLPVGSSWMNPIVLD